MPSTNFYRRELTVNMLTDYILCHYQYNLTTFKTITLVYFQLDTKIKSYLFTYNTIIKILYIFQVLPCGHARAKLCSFVYCSVSYFGQIAP
jgi:hypothetical protein